MIWAALSIVLTVLLAVWTARPRARAFALGSPAHWLVLPDEPLPAPASALPCLISVRSTLPAVVVAYPAWSASSQGWRADKPLKPWFRSMAPYAVVAAFGAVSLDLSGLGLGVPEIAPAHLSESQPVPQDLPAAGLGLDADLSVLFGTPPDSPLGLESVAWDQSDFTVPAWQRPPEPSHDWWV
jgi:hypothetical protein